VATRPLCCGLLSQLQVLVARRKPSRQELEMSTSASFVAALAAGGLGGLTAVAALVANNFWAMQGPERFAATNASFEHLGLVGGLALAAAITAQRKGNAEHPRG
jgi:hypothetical protein